MADESKTADDTIIIKKYANRRLYNTASSSYITLDDLAKMTRNGVDFQVLDAKTGSDITHSILTQIIMDEESQGDQHMLPVSFLRQLIGMYGNSMQAMMPSYLEASMETFRANQTKLQETFSASVGPQAFAKLAENNIAMFEAATRAFMPNAGEEKPADATASSDDLDTLKAQMAAMQAKLDKLGE